MLLVLKVLIYHVAAKKQPSPLIVQIGLLHNRMQTSLDCGYNKMYIGFAPPFTRMKHFEL